MCLRVVLPPSYDVLVASMQVDDMFSQVVLVTRLSFGPYICLSSVILCYVHRKWQPLLTHAGL